MSFLSLRALSTAALVLASAGALAACGASSGAAGAPAPRTSASNIVTAAQIAESPGVPLPQILQARVGGLRLSNTPDGEIAIQIRGATTTGGATSWPLYVIDGMPIDPGTDGAMPRVNREDIVSIEVIKDPGGMALYGQRGGSGVIVITTRRGR